MTNKTNSQNESGMVTIFDGVPALWNFIVGLNPYDLVTELVQNDLDQDATRTVISFEKDRLVCEGNGKPVNDEGWKRLRVIQGAGDNVPAKRGKIGVKNHGLKTAFTIGDEIRLMSAKQFIVQTLYANGRDKKPYPGASDKPTPDLQAPSKGCRIVVPYRRTSTEIPHGEAAELPAIDDSEIEELFRRARKTTLEQFVGIVSPDLVPEYEIVFKHWKLGKRRFKFSYTNPRKISKRMELFRRLCTVSETTSSSPKVVEEHREQAVRRLVPLESPLKERIADFYRRGRRFYVEVSWPINRAGRPEIGKGRFRYPIGYPQESQEALTGHGAHFNAPFASDNKRHGPARNEGTYEELRQDCESLLIDAIAVHSVPRYGPRGLNPLVPNSGTDNHEKAVLPLLKKLAKRGKLPLLNWREAAELILKGKKNQELHHIPKRSPRENRIYRCFVIPKASWDTKKIEPKLSLLCPRSEMQLDHRIHQEIVRLLAGKKFSGREDDFITFDEADAFARVTDGGNDYFDGIANLKRELSHLLIARSYLDLIDLAIEEGQCDEDKQQDLIESLLLPDIRGTARPLQDLYLSVKLPPDFPDFPELKLHHLLHDDLDKHPLFKRKGWKRKKYTMIQFLESSGLQDANESTRKRFGGWLRQNEQLITTPQERSELVNLAIWPDSTGRLFKLSELCVPSSQRIAKVLAGEIRRPRKQVIESKLISVGRNSSTSIRRTANKGEITSWLNKRREKFKVGECPDADTEENLRRFEDDLAILLKDKKIASILESVEESIPALAQDGSIQHRTELVMPSNKNKLLKLPERFMLKDKRHANALGKIWPPNSPTAEMLLDAFSEDNKNFSALQARLRCFLNLTSLGDPDRLELADKPIIPMIDKDGNPVVDENDQQCVRAPSELAFISRKDYWGSWKKRIGVRGLSLDAQNLYRAVGVTSAKPDSTTRREFFEWLSLPENQDKLEQHIPQVLRHILLDGGPTRWSKDLDDIPFIPVNGTNGLELVSLEMAQSKPIFLLDTSENEDEVISKNERIRLVVTNVKRVEEPIFEQLRRLGVSSLREELGEPKKVVGENELARAQNEDTISLINKLRDKAFQKTFLKRLEELDLSPESVDQRWKDRLKQINEIKFASKVVANYRLLHKEYSRDVEAGFDRKSGTFWIRQNPDPSNIYLAIAEQVIFKPGVKRVVFLALEKTVNMQFKDRSSKWPVIDTVVDETDEGEAINGHAPVDTEELEEKEQLETGTIPPINGNKPGVERPRGRNRRKTHTSEKKQIADLRKKYLNHCQMCLCEQLPYQLAPVGSYIEWSLFRQSVIEANHVALQSAGGARHAGNLILLCKLHHRNFGNKLSRATVIELLKNKAEKRKVGDFPKKNKGKELDGWEIEYEISDTREVVKFFFTNEHKKYWLEQAADESA